MSDVPPSHPRHASLAIRDRIVDGVDRGITSIHGLIAHGRGEAFDYLLGECTRDFARIAVDASACRLLLARHPVISVNGNTAALVACELVRLSEAVPAPLEVNIFHTSSRREGLILEFLMEFGASEVLLPTREACLEGIDSNRKFVHPDGIYRSDLIFVPLEDGDRCEALRRLGRDIITVDLNPLSRTAAAASVTIVDHVVRVMPLLLARLDFFRHRPVAEWHRAVDAYDHATILSAALRAIRSGAGPLPTQTAS